MCGDYRLYTEHRTVSVHCSLICVSCREEDNRTQNKAVRSYTVTCREEDNRTQNKAVRSYMYCSIRVDNYRAQNKAVRSYTVVSEWTITGHRTRLFAHMIIREKDYSTLNRTVHSFD